MPNKPAVVQGFNVNFRAPDLLTFQMARYLHTPLIMKAEIYLRVLVSFFLVYAPLALGSGPQQDPCESWVAAMAPHEGSIMGRTDDLILIAGTSEGHKDQYLQNVQILVKEINQIADGMSYGIGVKTEIFIVIDEAYRNRRVGTEAMRVLIHYIFTIHPDVPNINNAVAQDPSDPSTKMHVDLGFVDVGTTEGVTKHVILTRNAFYKLNPDLHQ
jgi:hypothetical protein